MILRKPYGFLIKHFKKINLLLLIPILYISLKFGDISTFFREYVGNSYRTVETAMAGKYITLFMYIVLILLIINNLVIYLLMKNKKKPTKEYGFTIIYYLVLLVMTIIFYNAMTSIELSTLEAASANMVRDFAVICPLPNYIIMLLTFFRGIGFNIKTFSFDNNLDLQVTDEDEAEFELKVGAEDYVIKRNIVHTLREIKYYIFENKFVFSCIGILLCVVLFISFYMNFQVYNKKYNLNEAFALDSFTLSLKESYITDVDYSGNKINKDKYYLAIKLGIQNRTQDSAKLEKSNFRIYIKDKIIYPSYDRSNRFIDIGNSYQGTTIYGESSDTYVLVYEIDKSLIKSSYKMKILSNLKYDAGELVPSYKIIKIKPKNIIEKEDLGESNVGNEISLKDTLLEDTKYKLHSIEFVKKYEYQYEQCKNNKSCYQMTDVIVPSSGKVLAVIKDNIVYDEETSYYNNSNLDFYGDFATIKYNYINSSNTSSELSTTLKDVTPNGLTNVKVYEVSSLVMNGTDKQMVLTFRNKKVIINLE